MLYLVLIKFHTKKDIKYYLQKNYEYKKQDGFKNGRLPNLIGLWSLYSFSLIG